jgi:hypothetical protein
MCFVFLGATPDGKDRLPFSNPYGARRRNRGKAKEAERKTVGKQASR